MSLLSPELQARLERVLGQRIVNAMDFICIRDIRTTLPPQTWDYRPKKATWMQRQAFYPKCPNCVISNAGLELVVREL